MRKFALYLKVAVLLSVLMSLPMAGLASVPSRSAGQPGTAVQDDGITITGIVRDEGSQPMVGAIVYSPEYNIATMTDNKGWYSITVPRTGIEIQVSFIGYKTFSFTVGNKAVQNVLLEDETHTLDDAVVVAYGTQRKATVTGSVAAVSTKDLLQSPQANISNALAGRMPGLLSVQRSGEPGNDASTLRIRGVGTFAGDQDPLIMVDGIETENYNNIDPNEIESITILKDASATAVYGVRGANGVLLIQTKRGELGKPKVSGAISIGTESSTLPTDASTELDPTFKGLGYCSEDGVTNSEERDSEDIVAWGGDTVSTRQTTYKESFSFTPIEVNPTVARATYGDDNVTVTAGKMTVRHNSKELPAKPLVIETVPNDKTVCRLVVPRAKLTEKGDATYNDSDPMGRELTYIALPDEQGNTAYEYYAITGLTEEA